MKSMTADTAQALRPATRALLRRLRFRHLELLDVLGRTPTFSAASVLLNLSQPAVSKMIGEMEVLCDAPLFVRGRTGIGPTPQGLALMRHAAAMVSSLDSAAQEIQAIAQGSSGLLRIGAYSTTSVVPRMVVGLLAHLPLLRIRIQDGSPIQLLAMLLSGELDCVIAAFSRDMLALPHASELRVQPIVADRICVVASRAHRWAGRKRIAWEDAARERWTLPPIDALMNKELSYALTQFGVEPIVPVIESMSALTTRWLMKFDGALLGVMREHQAVEEVANGGLIILPVRPHIRLPDIALITPSRRLLDLETFQALQRALRDCQVDSVRGLESC